MNDRKLRAIVGLALFRAFFGALAIAAPWVVGNGLDAYGTTEVATGVALVALAPLMHRAPWLRWVQASLAMVLFFSPFLFGEDVGDRQIYCAVLIGHVVLVSSIVKPGLFGQEPSEATSAIDSSRSVGSNTSNVNTPLH